MRIRIDPGLCQATGYCVRVAPVLFELARGGGPTRVTVDDVPPDLRELALEAEGICPTNAISVESQRTGALGR